VRAVDLLDRAQVPDKTSGLGPGWDDTVAATRAFLLRDRAQLLAAKQRVVASQEPSEEVDELIEHCGVSCADMRWWASLRVASGWHQGGFRVASGCLPVGYQCA
jgi:hypothetical protein